MAHPFTKRDETAPMIASVWGPTLSTTVAALIVERPHLGHRLALAQRKVVHGLAAYILHALEQNLDESAIADAVDVQDIRDLLASAIPETHSSLYGLFDRVGDKAMPLAFYRRVNDVLRGPASDLLLDREVVNEPCLGIIEVIASDPVLLSARKAIGNCSSNLNIVRTAVAFVRATGLSADVEQLPAGSSWRALKRRITADLGRASAPPLQFRQPQGWLHVEKMSELLRIGTKLENCIAGFGRGGIDHLLNFISGTEVFFVAEAEPLTLASVQSVGPGLWQIAETAGAARPSGVYPKFPELRLPLTDVLAEIGHVLLAIAPGSALQSITWRAEHSAGALGEDDEMDEAA